jgi:uncharacterized membrane protein
MLMSIAVALHALAATIWVGGMFFAVYALRPAAGPMDGPDRLALWGRVFPNFFRWVWTAVIVLPATGYYMVYAGYGGFVGLPIPYHVMSALGLAMIVIFLHLYYAPYARFREALAGGRNEEAARQLNTIRLLVTGNLYLGLANASIGASGVYWGS